MGVNDQFEVTEELPYVTAMCGKTTAVCDTVEHVGLSWDKLVGVTKDGGPLMTGSKDGLVALCDVDRR